MGKKRKIDAMRVSASEGSQGISAFAAARRDRQNPVTKLEDQTSESIDPKSRQAHSSFPQPEDPEQNIYDSASEIDHEENKESAISNASKDHVLSTWRPSKRNVHATDPFSLTISLGPGEYIGLVGQYDLRVHSGKVIVYGALLEAGPTPHRVFAPSSHPIPSIYCLPSGSSEIQVESVDNKIEFLQDFSTLFRNLWGEFLPISDQVAEDLNQRVERASFAYVVQSNDKLLRRPLKPLNIPDQWQNLAENLTRPSDQSIARAIFVCGAATHAKSTFCRYLVNRFLSSTSRPLTSICWLDLDASLPEYSPPGQLSLVQIRRPVIGPAFTHPYTDPRTSCRMIRAHTLGSLSAKEDPEHFLAIAANLIQRYHDNMLPQFPTCPLLINYPAWSRSVGEDLMKRFIRSATLTNIVCLDDLLTPELAGNVPCHTIPSSSESNTTAPFVESKDLRAMQEISYFHQDEVGDDGHLQWRWEKVRDYKRPYLKLAYGSHQPNLLGCIMLGQQPSDEFYWTVLDESIVAIVLIEDEALAIELRSSLKRTQEHGLPYIPGNESDFTNRLDPQKTRLVGQAILLDIDKDSSTLTLHTPVQTIELEAAEQAQNEESDCPRLLLVRGCLEAPGWAYLEALGTSYNRDEEDSMEAFSEDPDLLAEDERFDAYVAEQLGPDFQKSVPNPDDDRLPWLSELSVRKGTARPRELP